MGRKLQIKRGAKAALPALAPGELALTTDEKTLYYGTGAENISVAREEHRHEAWQVGAVKRGDPVPFLVDRYGQTISFGAKLTGSNAYGDSHPRIEVLDDREKGADASILVPYPTYWNDAANKQYVDTENTTIAMPYLVYDDNNASFYSGTLIFSKNFIGSSRWNCFLSGAVILGSSSYNIKKIVVSTGSNDIGLYGSGSTINSLALINNGSAEALQFRSLDASFDSTLHELTITIQKHYNESWQAIIISSFLGSLN